MLSYAAVKWPSVRPYPSLFPHIQPLQHVLHIDGIVVDGLNLPPAGVRRTTAYTHCQNMASQRSIHGTNVNQAPTCKEPNIYLEIKPVHYKLRWVYTIWGQLRPQAMWTPLWHMPSANNSFRLRNKSWNLIRRVKQPFLLSHDLVMPSTPPMCLDHDLHISHVNALCPRNIMCLCVRQNFHLW